MENNNFFLNTYKKKSNLPFEDNFLENKKDLTEKNNSITNNEPSTQKDSVRKVVFEKLEEVEKAKQSTTNETPISKKRLAAIFLLLIGLERAKDVIKNFSEDELIKIIGEITNIETITDNDIAEVEKNFGKIGEKRLEELNGKDFIRSLLQKSFGMAKGSEYFLKVVEKTSDNNFDFLNELHEEKIKEIIGDESDMVVALIFGMIDPKKAAKILSLLPRERSVNIIKKISSKIEINSDVLNVIIKKIKERAQEVKNSDKETIKISGKNRLIEILKNSSQTFSETILDALEENEPDLANELKEKIFTFNDIVNIPKKDFEKALKDYPDKEIAFILKGAKDEIKMIFFSSITKRRKDIIIDEIKVMGEVLKKDVDDRRRKFVEYLKNLESNGKIILKYQNETYVE